MANDDQPLDAATVLAIGREVLNGVSEEDSKFAPLTPAMKQARADYEASFAKIPEGVVIDIPYSTGEPDNRTPEQIAADDKHVADRLARHAAMQAIKANSEKQK